MDALERITACTGFDWDAGNVVKIWESHGVTAAECEEVSLNRPLVAAPDEPHSATERRYYALGQTDGGRGLFVVFTIRGDLIRVVTARDMSRNERRSYRSHEEEDADNP